MNASRAVDASGKLTAEFAAYTKLTVANRLISQIQGQAPTKTTSMSFEEFMDALEKNTAGKPEYARPVPKTEISNNQIYAQHHGYGNFQQVRFSIIEEAYALGLVDRNGVLISSFDSKG
ncbi:hypothetical protein DUZ99_14300 [Xylanibacillus composti]|uniref:Uncharacterized protein n=1 Tax=Xylanibacillus composti TaxID=1572762 RepID=A0A8J4H6C8_9BACL|nr:hypothetical protein [Xylanibacillus composti]MDT9726148.1 hypothetical protein [Xylanibacillus composti]GIQ70616.1 hypothetical protein XYCOK13_34400 [Xylanibacillus composti]